jgi:hypothetical protein
MIKKVIRLYRVPFLIAKHLASGFLLQRKSPCKKYRMWLIPKETRKPADGHTKAVKKSKSAKV